MFAVSKILLALGLFAQATAFSVTSLQKSTRNTALTSTAQEIEWFPTNMPMKRIDGPETLATFQMPVDQTRCQMYFRTDGRPLRAKIELWLGPLRRTHFMNIESMDGNVTPFRATLKFKTGGQVLKVSTPDPMCPLWCGIYVPSKGRCKELERNTVSTFDNAPRTRVQGGAIEGGVGAVRTFMIEDHVESVQILMWAKNTGKKSFKAKIEVLQGPNNNKQTYDMQCGGGSQPYHAVFATPGAGVQLRIYNKKFVEDGLFEVAVLPYEIGEPIDPNAAPKQWWE